jgi:hypothetical protein
LPSISEIMKNYFFFKWLHVDALIIFAAITFAYFNPVLQGKQLSQTDLIQWKGAAKEILDHREKFGEEALWTNSMFGGMPATQIAVSYLNNAYHYVHQAVNLVFPESSGIIFLCLIAFYILLISLNVPQPLAIAGSIGFAFNSYNFIMIVTGHITKGWAIGYMSLVVAGVIFTFFKKEYWKGGSILIVGLALHIYSNHLQMTYYLLVMLVILGMIFTIDALRKKEFDHYLKSMAFLVIAAILGILPNTTLLWSTYDYGKETTRGKSELTMNQEVKTTGLDKDYATQWSYGVGETFSLMIPNFKGGGSGAFGNNHDALDNVDPQLKQIVSGMDKYFGDQPWTLNVYAGAIICFLFVLGLFFVEGPVKWWLLIATALSIMLAWGKNFMPLTDFFLDYVPGYNKFRAVSNTLVIAQITIPLLGILGLKNIVKTPELLKTKRNFFWLSVGFTGGLSFLMYLMPDTFNNFFKAGEYESIMDQLKEAGWPAAQGQLLIENLADARKSLFTSDALRTTLFIMLSAGLIFAYFKKLITPIILSAAFAFLILVDNWPVAQRFMSSKDFVSKSAAKAPIRPTNADLQILQDPDLHYRVVNFTVSTFNDATTSYFHKSIGGYHGAKLKRFQELIEYQISDRNMDVYNMLNTKYFIVPGENNQPVARQNPGALGNAWFVQEYELVLNADSEIVALTDFDPSTLAIIDQRFSRFVEGKNFQKDEEGEITLMNYKPNHMKYDYKASSEQLVVFSEIFYDRGWNAFINGQPAEHFRVNYVLRAMVVPAGNHLIEFKFQPVTFFTGERIALAGSVLSLLFIGFTFYRGRKKTAEL